MPRRDLPYLPSTGRASLGSGRVWTPVNVTVVHFGSPQGVTPGVKPTPPPNSGTAMHKPIIHFGSPMKETP